MPFPANRLHYDLRIRLAELSTPAERYNLQLAAGNFNICPPNFQKVKKRHACTFKTDKPDPCEVYGYRHINGTEFKLDWWRPRKSGDTLTECTGSLALIGFGLADLCSDDMNHVILRPSSMCLIGCDVSVEFLQKLLSMTTPFGSLQYKFKALGVADTLKVFPDLQTLKIYKCPSSPWLADLASAPNNELEELEIEGSLEELVTFTVDDVKAYFQTLHREFHINLLITNGQRQDPLQDESWKVEDKKLKEELREKLKEIRYWEDQPRAPHITVASLVEYQRSFFWLNRKRGHE